MARILLGGRYQILREVSRNGFSKTYVAEDTLRRNSPRYAVKQITPNRTDTVYLQAARKIFEQESQIMYHLGTHDQIPRLYAHLEQNGEFYLVQEFIEGHNLKSVPLGTRVDEAKVLEFLREVLDVLVFVHENNATHGDLKPDNLVRRHRDNKLILVDFSGIKSIRTPLGDTSGQVASQIMNGYAAPEQIGGYAQMSSDVYALGILAIQYLTGLMPSQFPKHPKTKEFVWKDQAQVSDDLAEILSKMVRLNSAQRYQSAMAVQQALLCIESGNCSTVNSEGNSNVVVGKPKFTELAPRFDYAGNFAEGLAAVAIADKYGYIDKTGKFVIEPLFDFNWVDVFYSGALQFSEGLARIETSDRYGYIDKNGKFIVHPQFDGADNFSGGLGRVEIGHQYGYINKAGKFLLEPQFPSAARSFKEGLAWVEITNKYAYIDRLGRVAIKPRFDSADDFCEGLARVVVDSQYGFIDKNGNFVIPPQFDVAHSFSEGLARVRVSDKYGYINAAGKIVIEPQFDDNSDFTQGLALVRIGEKHGYINQQGKLVIGLQFDEAYPFHENMAAVRIGKSWGFIDRSGIFVINLRYEDAGSFNEGMAWVKTDSKYGYIANPML